MTSCPDEASILSFGRGDMTSARSTGVASHVEGCDECRVLVAAVRRASIVDAAEVTESAAQEPLPRATAEPAVEPAQGEAVLAPHVSNRAGRTLLIAACACALVVLGLLLRFVAH